MKVHGKIYKLFLQLKIGNIRRNQLSDFTNIRQNGKIAMKLNDNDELVSVIPCGDKDNILLMATRLRKSNHGLMFMMSEFLLVGDPLV